MQRTLVGAERQLGADLFERTARGVTPTDAGRAVAAHAQERRDLDSVLGSRLAELKGVQRGHLAIATGESYLRELWRTTLAPIFDEHPGIQVRLHTAGRGGIVDLLVTTRSTSPSHCTLAPTLPRPWSPARHNHCGWYAIPTTRSRPAPRSIPASWTVVTLVILPPAFGLRMLHDELLRTHGVQVIARFEAESKAAILEVVLSGHVLALLPPVTVRQHVERGRLVAVPLDDPQTAAVQARLLVRTGRRLTPASRALVAACRAGLFRRPLTSEQQAEDGFAVLRATQKRP